MVKSAYAARATFAGSWTEIGCVYKRRLTSRPEKSPETAAAGAGEGLRPRMSAWQRFTAGWRRLMLLTLAGVFFVLGALGVLLPGIPATPFLLLTSYFLVRSSPRLNAWLLRSRFFGPVLVDWQIHGGVRPRVRYKAIVAVVIAVALTIYLSGYSRFATVVVVVLASIGIVVIWKLPAAKDS